MDFLDLLRLMLRRWWITIPGILLTFGATAFVYNSIEPTYQTEGRALLFRPAVVDNAAFDQNRWLQFGSLDIPAITLSDLMMEPEVGEELFADVPVTSYNVAADTSRGPSLVVSAEGETPDIAETAAKLLIARLGTELVDQQVALGAPIDTLITLEVISQPDDVVVANGSRSRAMVIAMAVGIALTIGAVTAFDPALRRRAARKQAADPEAEVVAETLAQRKASSAG